MNIEESREVYTENAVKADDLSCLEFVVKKVAKHAAGKYCAVKWMNYYGYDVSKLRHYILGAVEARNAKTLVYLKDKGLDIQDMFDHMSCYMSREDIVFATQNGISLTRTMLGSIRCFNYDLYCQIQEEV